MLELTFGGENVGFCKGFEVWVNRIEARPRMYCGGFYVLYNILTAKKTQISATDKNAACYQKQLRCLIRINIVRT